VIQSGRFLRDARHRVGTSSVTSRVAATVRVLAHIETAAEAC